MNGLSEGEGSLHTSRLRWWRGQGLIGKFALILVLAGVVFVPLVYFALQLLLAPTFTRIEERVLEQHAARARHSLEAYGQTLDTSVSDYSVWDSAYDYILTGDAAFEAETLEPNAYQNMGIDVQGYIANDGLVRWSNAVEPVSGEILKHETEFFGKFFSSGAFFKAALANPSYTDFVRTERGLYLINAQHIVRSDESGPSPGFVAMGILLDAKTLSDALQVDVTLNIDPSAQDIAQLQTTDDHTHTTVFDEYRATRIGLINATGRVVGFIEYQVPRNATMAGQRAIRLATIGVTAVMVMLILILSIAIRRIAVNRLQRLEAQVTRMRDGDFDITEDLVDGDDEISRLAHQFVQLDHELDAANAELHRTAYLQGKADSAAGMLHNVRNSLAPLRVLQQRWLDEEAQDFRRNMERATAELDDPACPPDRRQALERFMVSAAGEIARGGPARREVMAEAKEMIDKIAGILNAFDFDTSGRMQRSVLDPLKLIQLEVRSLSGDRFEGITFDLPDAIASVTANRSQLGQVFGNLLVNAAEAVLSAAPADPRISVVSRVLDGGAVEIRVRDNGDGIAPDKIASVFERGYSTRDGKSGGLGMHWSAIAVRTMGGELSIESAGTGQGATAIIVLSGANASAEVGEYSKAA